MLIVCRRDLDEQTVYRLTEQLFNVFPRLARVEATLRFLNLDEAPATPIPLHKGAARYFRNGNCRGELGGTLIGDTAARHPRIGNRRVCPRADLNGYRAVLEWQHAAALANFAPRGVSGGAPRRALA